MRGNSPTFRPFAEPVVIENAYTPDQHARIMKVLREKGPWPMIIAQNFKTPEERLSAFAVPSPEDLKKKTWDGLLDATFSAHLAKGHTSLYPEIEDCFYNQKFLDLVRGYWGAEYARPEYTVFNIQGPVGNGRATVHFDTPSYRGVSTQNSPIWLLNVMTKSGLFEHWYAKKAQVITWYYAGKIGGGFIYWPEGPGAAPKHLKSPMWGRAVVTDNEHMYHTREDTGPSALRRAPEGLAYESKVLANPEGGGWRIMTGDTVIRELPEEEFRLMVHWGADIFMDYAELKRALDQKDDLTHDQVFDMFIADLRARGAIFEVPTDPMKDRDFVGLLNRTYQIEAPAIYPAEPDEMAVG